MTVSRVSRVERGVLDPALGDEELAVRALEAAVALDVACDQLAVKVLRQCGQLAG